MYLSGLKPCRMHDLSRTLGSLPWRVLRPMPPEPSNYRQKDRDNCPGSVAAVHAKARFARPHDRLITMLDADLVEDGGNVIAHGFLGQFQRRGDLGIVEPAGDGIEYRALARRKLVERQRGGGGCSERGLQKRPHLAGQLRPCRLFGERHVVLAVERDEPGIRDEARARTAPCATHSPTAV